MKSAPDDVAWSQTVERVLPTWLGLRVALAREGVAALGLDTLEQAIGAVADLPLTLLPEPAHGAAVYAVDVLAWLASQAIGAPRRGARIDVEALDVVLHDLAVIELCWLTLVGAPRPGAAVAEAASWEAYSRTRPLRAALVRIGLDTASMPVESPDEAVSRGLALLDGVATGWTDEDRRAVAEARLPEPLFP